MMTLTEAQREALGLIWILGNMARLRNDSGREQLWRLRAISELAAAYCSGHIFGQT